jgi:nicotinate-nucleotide pyrophosphorylase (carboxylating)
MELSRFLKEDLGKGDITSEALLSNEKVQAEIIAKESCVLAGLKEAIALFKLVNVRTRTKLKEGLRIRKSTTVLELNGKVKDILKAERTALNFLMKLSGIATLTSEFIEKARKVNSNLVIAGTRKTTPGLRKYEKRAILVAGGYPHRYGLYDKILIKSNHIRVIGSVRECIARAKRVSKEVEIEVENLSQAIEAAKVNPDIIMLDNFSVANARKTFKLIKKLNPNIKVEISGGITLKNILRYAKYADIISIGKLTHSPKAIDFSLKIKI